MKIKKSQLRSIIREERSRLLDEDMRTTDPQKIATDALDSMDAVMVKLHASLDDDAQHYFEVWLEKRIKKHLSKWEVDNLDLYNPKYDLGYVEGYTGRQLREIISETLCERNRGNRPHLNKYDPGSLLGHLVYLLDENGLHDEADYLRTTVSPMVADAWQNRER